MAGIGRPYPGEEEEEKKKLQPQRQPQAQGRPVAGPSYGGSSTSAGVDPQGQRLAELEQKQKEAAARKAELAGQQEATLQKRQAEVEAAGKALEDWQKQDSQWYVKGSKDYPIYERWDEHGNVLAPPTHEEVEAHQQAGVEARRRDEEARRVHAQGLPEDEALKQKIATVGEAHAELGARAEQLRQGLPETGVKDRQSGEVQATPPKQLPAAAPQEDTRPGAWRAMTVTGRAQAQPVGGTAGAHRDEMERQIAQQEEEQRQRAETRQAQDPHDERRRKQQQKEMADFEDTLRDPYPWVAYKKGEQYATSPEAVAPFLLDRYLEIRDGGKGSDKAARAARRDELVRSMGLQPGDERGAVDRIRESMGGRRQQERLTSSAGSAAMLNRVLLAAGVTQRPKDYEDWKHANDKRGTFKQDAEASYYYAWRSTGAEMEKRLQPIAAKLEGAYEAMKQGDLALGRFYDEVAPEDRALFLTSLRMVAEQMPAQGSTTVWEQVKKSNERFWRDAGSSMQDFWEKPWDSAAPEAPPDIHGKGWLGRMWRDHDVAQYKKDSREWEADQLKRMEIDERRHFREDINHINDQVFDPIRVLHKDGWWAGMLEQAAYQAPGALATIGMAALPGGWAPLAIKGRDDTRRDLRRYLLDNHVEEGRANEMADTFSLALTVPMVALDRLQAGGMMRKMPFFEEAMKKASGKIANGALRFATETTLRGGEMAASNMLQEPLPELAKEAMHALEKDVPGADWGQFFSGYWTRQASTMAVMLPLTEAGRAEFVKEHPEAGRLLDHRDEVKGQRARHLDGEIDTAVARFREEHPGVEVVVHPAARMEGHFREERTHLLQFEAVRRTLPPGKDYETHFRETYDALHAELTPEQLAAARTSIGAWMRSAPIHGRSTRFASTKRSPAW